MQPDNAAAHSYSDELPATRYKKLTDRREKSVDEIDGCDRRRHRLDFADFARLSQTGYVKTKDTDMPFRAVSQDFRWSYSRQLRLWFYSHITSSIGAANSSIRPRGILIW
jgi:hypothetical protein